jgi:long-chain acyl-CoA synthetase
MIDESLSPEAEQGEIVVYGPNVMRGYHNRGEETQQALGGDGGLRTGDLGRIDEEGFLYVTGRLKEQYKLENGKYVMPTPLEEALKLSPYISSVMLYGANKPYNVALNLDAIKVWAAASGIELQDPATDDSVRRLIKSELDRHAASFRAFERPRRFAITLEDFSSENGLITPTLKVKRRNVVERYGADIEALYSSDQGQPAEEPRLSTTTDLGATS